MIEIAEFTKECSVKWRQLTPEQKKRFDEQAAKDKGRYDAEVCVCCFNHFI